MFRLYGAFSLGLSRKVVSSRQHDIGLTFTSLILCFIPSEGSPIGMDVFGVPPALTHLLAVLHDFTRMVKERLTLYSHIEAIFVQSKTSILICTKEKAVPSPSDESV
jgi:hypothetical protein